MAQQLAMVIDAAKCIDCKACVAACKVANQVLKGSGAIGLNRPTIRRFPAKKRCRQIPARRMHALRKPHLCGCLSTGATLRIRKPAKSLLTKDCVLDAVTVFLPVPMTPVSVTRSSARRISVITVPSAGAVFLQHVWTLVPPRLGSLAISMIRQRSGRLYLKNKDRLTRVAAKTDTKPNMFYLGNPGPGEWGREAIIPASMVAMKQSAPLVKGIVALSGLGVLAMLGRQLFVGSDSDHKEDSDA